MDQFHPKDTVFARLSDDVIIHVCGFLAVQFLGRFSCCSRSTYICCDHEELWVAALHHLFPSSTSFARKIANPSNSFRTKSVTIESDEIFPIAASKQKIRKFSRKSFNISSVGNLRVFRSRFLHRCVTNQNGTNFIFGGVSTSTNTNFGSFSDVWKVTVNETDQKIVFSRVPIISKMNDHVPGSSSAGGMCVISTGDILLFGGIIDTVFSSQFWLLRLSDQKSRGGNIKESNRSHTTDSCESVTLIGEWQDIRMQSLLSDEQIAVNEHIAFVMANNNQIIMEVNNQYNSDDDNDDEYIPDVAPQYTDERGGFVAYEGAPCSRKKGEMPPGRWGHTFIYYENFVFLYGGSRPGTSYGDIWVASERELLAGNFDCWSELVTGRKGFQNTDLRTGLHIPEAPEPRGGHAATVLGDYMYVFGGNDVNRTFSDLWRISLKNIIDCVKKQWEIEKEEKSGIDDSDNRCKSSEGTRTSAAPSPFKYPTWDCLCRNAHLEGGPSPLIGHCATAVGRKILVFGGRDIHKLSFGTGVFFYDTVSGLWEDASSKTSMPSLISRVGDNDDSDGETNAYEEGNDSTSQGSDDWQDLGSEDVYQGSIERRTGQCAIPCSSGVLYIGGLCESGSSTSEILHLNLFGMYTPADFHDKERLSLISRNQHVPPVSSSASSYVDGAGHISDIGISNANAMAPLLSDAVQKWSALSAGSFGHLSADDDNSIAHKSLVEKRNNIRNLDVMSECRSYQIIEYV